MHPPTPRRVAALVLPVPAPVPVLAGKVSPPSSKSFCHVTGTVQGARLSYADMNAFSWYAGQAGRELRGARVAFGRRGLSGSEDTTRRKA